MKKEKIFYSKCPKCKDYYEEATSVTDARMKIEAHEKECHKGKPIGIFGWALVKSS